MSSQPELPPLSSSQLEVMHFLWERGEATVTDVWQHLSQHREVARNTVLTVIDRLTKRGWLNKTAVGNTHLYRPTVAKDKALGNVVQRMVETAFAGSADQMVMALLDGRGITSEEAARIRKLIDESRTKRRKKRTS